MSPTPTPAGPGRDHAPPAAAPPPGPPRTARHRPAPPAAAPPPTGVTPRATAPPAVAPPLAGAAPVVARGQARERRTACSPAPGPSRRRTRATDGPAHAVADGFEHDRARLDRPPVHVREHAGVQRGEPRVGEGRAGEHGRRGQRRRPRALGEHGEADGGHQRGGRARPVDEEPGHQRREHEVPRVLAHAASASDGRHTRGPGGAASGPGVPAPRSTVRALRQRRRPARAVARRDTVRSDPDVVAERRQAFLADAGDLVELVDRLEAAVLLAVVDDLLGGGRTDAVEGLELLERGRVQVDRT